MRTSLLMLAVLAACPGPTPATTDSPDPGTTTTTSSTSTTSTDPTSTSTGTTTAAPPDLPPPCPVGALGCPCTAGGACDPSLTCAAGLCVEGCAVGMEGCACTQGGACDAGLVCEAETCVPAPDPVSPPCMAGNQDDCCGDAVLDEFEECDLWTSGNTEHSACTPQCKNAACGDGYLHNPFEACDGEEFCADDCTFTSCGNGTVEPHEWCEPTSMRDLDCTPMCTDARKIVFITSEHYYGGELGGLDGAHAICQMHADMAGLNIKAKAFLATTAENSPSVIYWSHKDIAQVDVQGNFMGDAASDFCGSGDIANVPDENGNPHPGSSVEYIGTDLWVWSMWEFWTPDEPGTCDEWTNVNADAGSALASPCTTSAIGAPCNATAPIYCIEE